MLHNIVQCPGRPTAKSSPTLNVNRAGDERLRFSPRLRACFGEEVQFDVRTRGC